MTGLLIALGLLALQCLLLCAATAFIGARLSDLRRRVGRLEALDDGDRRHLGRFPGPGA